MDSGMYQCVAENKYGAVYSGAELKILGKFLHTVQILQTNGFCVVKQSLQDVSQQGDDVLAGGK